MVYGRNARTKFTSEMDGVAVTGPKRGGGGNVSRRNKSTPIKCNAVDVLHVGLCVRAGRHEPE